MTMLWVSKTTQRELKRIAALSDVHYEGLLRDLIVLLRLNYDNGTRDAKVKEILERYREGLEARGAGGLHRGMDLNAGFTGRFSLGT